MSVLTLRSADGTIECGCRFKHIPTQITMSYQNLVNAIADAIDKEAAEHDNKFVTDERVVNPIAKEYDYDALMLEFQEIVGVLMNSEAKESNQRKITSIIDKYLGKGKKVAEATPEQAELIYLIVTEIKEDLM